MAASSSFPLSATVFQTRPTTADVYLHSVPAATTVKFSLREVGSRRTYLSGQLNIVGQLTPQGLEQIFLSERRPLLGFAVGGIEYGGDPSHFMSYLSASTVWKDRPFSDIVKEHRDLVILLTSLGLIPPHLWETKTGGSVFPRGDPPGIEWLPVSCRFESKETGKYIVRAISINPCTSIAQLRQSLDFKLGSVSDQHWTAGSDLITSVGLAGDVGSGLPGEHLVRHYLGHQLVMMIESIHVDKAAVDKAVVDKAAAVSAKVEPETPAAMLERLLKMRDSEADLALRADQLQAELAEIRSRKAELKARLMAQIDELTK